MDGEIVQEFRYIFDSSIGTIEVVECNGALVSLNVIEQLKTEETAQNKPTALLLEAEKQLHEYLAGNRKEFTIPLDPKGTTFQEAVWKALLAIPYGETRSYRDIAVAIGKPKAVRAVGMANHRNPISFIIPCHRVIGADGSLVGYGGGLEMKKRLLDLEQKGLQSH